MATGSFHEILPPVFGPNSEPPPLFDGTTRLYTAFICPYAQRAWITRNFKGLQAQIQLVPMDLKNRPAWYKEKVYPPNKVPALEHNKEIRGESLDVIKYIDQHFDGPSLYPSDPTKRAFGDELLSYSDTFVAGAFKAFKGGVETEFGAPFDHLEAALSKFDDGPFFLGKEFSLVDVTYTPFVERFQTFLLEVKKYDIAAGRPKLAEWIEEINKIEAYKPTKMDPKVTVELLTKRISA